MKQRFEVLIGNMYTGNWDTMNIPKSSVSLRKIFKFELILLVFTVRPRITKVLLFNDQRRFRVTNLEHVTKSDDIGASSKLGLGYK